MVTTELVYPDAGLRPAETCALPPRALSRAVEGTAVQEPKEGCR